MFFGSYQAITVKQPVFIFGHPRSGTSFLHKLLTYTDEAAAFKTWHLLFPALSARFLVKYFIYSLIRKGKTELMPEWTGHKIDLDKIEEEEMLFIHNYDTQFTSSSLLGLDDNDYPELKCHDSQPRSRRIRSMEFLNGCFQRHIQFTGKEQIIAQTHFSTHRLKTMLEYYPDAKFIYIVRNPHHVVPSFLSLLHKSLDYRYGIDQIPPEVLSRFYKRRYQAMIDLYRYFYDLQKNGEVPKERVMVMPYDQLLADLEGMFDEICRFTGIHVSDELQANVERRSANQQQYLKRKSKHMKIEEFGLSREMISRDFSFVFKQYDIPDSWD